MRNGAQTPVGAPPVARKAAPSRTAVKATVNPRRPGECRDLGVVERFNGPRPLRAMPRRSAHAAGRVEERRLQSKVSPLAHRPKGPNRSTCAAQSASRGWVCRSNRARAFFVAAPIAASACRIGVIAVESANGAATEPGFFLVFWFRGIQRILAGRCCKQTPRHGTWIIRFDLLDRSRLPQKPGCCCNRRCSCPGRTAPAVHRADWVMHIP